MIPDVYATLSAASTVTAIVGARIYRTTAPQGETQPYVVWQLVTSVPENNLSNLPDMDDQRVQIDCYSLSQSQCRELGKAVRNAIEVVTHIVSGPWEDHESDTKLFRWSMDAEYWESR